MASNKLKMLYDQGKALMAPEDTEAESIKDKNENIDQYKKAMSEAKPAPNTNAPVKPSPNEMVGKGAYGSQPGEKRIDTSSMTKPLGSEEEKQEHLSEEQDLHPNMMAFHARGGELDPDKINVVGEEGPEEIVGNEVIPMNQLPEPQEEAMANIPDKGQMVPTSAKPSPSIPFKPPPSIPMPVTNGTKEAGERFIQSLPGTASPEERSKAIGVPNDGTMKSKTLEGMDQKSADARRAQLAAPTPAPPDPNQVIADQHAKVMKAKLDAASKGDLVGMGSAIIAGQALNSASPQATTAAEGGQVPDVNLAPGGANMPEYSGKERIGAGTPGEAQARKMYQDKLNDLDQRIITASQIHTPEGKQELGYLQSEKAVLQKMNPLGSAANKPGLLGKIEHGLGEVGNVVGNAVIPKIMPSIPGSQANLAAQTAQGEANVEQGSKEALRAAQTDKAQQVPEVKPQEKLAQEKLNAQTKLGQITQQMQDPKLAPEQMAALKQQAEQIYATNPEFRPKPEDQAKQAIGDQGAQQHAQQLETIAQAAGFTPEQTANQATAFGVKPTDSLATAEKKMSDAKAVAALDSSRRDRETARLAAENQRADAQAEKQEKATIDRNDKSYQYNKTRLDKLRKPVDDIATRMGKLQQTVQENTPLADALVAPELLTAMAGGQGSGLRMNEAEISRIVGGRGHWADLQAAINKWKLDPKAALSITPEQRREIRSLLDVASKRVQRATGIMDDANTALTNATSPEEHRRILDDVQGKLSRNEVGKVRVQIEGHPAADINVDQLEAFQKKYPNAQVE